MIGRFGVRRKTKFGVRRIKLIKQAPDPSSKRLTPFARVSGVESCDVKRILKHLVWIIPVILILIVVSLVAVTAAARRTDAQYHAKLPKTIQVTSDSFQHGQEMPGDLSCRGSATAPDIQWTQAPEATKSFSLIAMDWDAPSPRVRLFPVVHWVVYNIPATTTQIPKNSSSALLSQKGMTPGLNIARQPGYMAPCPPLGKHRYEFRIYALDVDRIDPAKNDKDGVIQAMQGHVLAYGELVGLKGP